MNKFGSQRRPEGAQLNLPHNFAHNRHFVRVFDMDFLVINSSLISSS